VQSKGDRKGVIHVVADVGINNDFFRNDLLRSRWLR
jgi:hypothetical protein